MLFQARRLLADLRQVGGWVISIALVAVVVSILAAYMATFGVAEARSGALTPAPPQQPLSFLRAIDPNESIMTTVESVEELDRSVLDGPGLKVLLDRMVQDDRMFIALPLNAFILDGRSGTTVDSRVTAVLGAAPPFLGEAPGGGVALLWGSLTDGSEGGTGVNDSSIHGHRVHRVSEQPIATEYVAGSGRRTFTSDAALVAFDVATGRDLGVSNPYHVSEVIRGFTCYCDVAELVDLADAMSEAESRAGTGRGFYPVGYEGVVGPVQRSRALAEMLNAGHAVGTLLSVWCLVVMVAQVFWARRSRVYLAERLCGSSEVAIQVRGQLLIALSLTLPALAGYELVNAALRPAGWPLPLPSDARILAIAGAAVLHTLAGAVTAVRIHRLCRFSEDEVRRV